MLLILRSKKKASKRIKELNRKLSAHLKKLGVSFEFASFEDIELFLANNSVKIKIKDKPLKTWETIYPRKVGIFNNLAHILASEASRNNILFIDNFHKKREDSSDATKISQMYLFVIGKVPISKTYCAATYSRKQIDNAIDYLGLPIIIKKSNTSQGAGVMLAKNKQELSDKLKNITDEEKNGGVFLQEYIPNDFEYRIFITGHTISATEKKIRTDKKEFRNNIHLGAREEFINPSSIKNSIKTTAIKAAKIANIQVAGVDIVESKDQLVVFEVNSCPGITLDEKISPEIKNLALYLSKCEKK